MRLHLNKDVMVEEVGWAGAVEISEVDIAAVASLYNDCVAKIDPFRFRLDMRGDFTLKPWCKDIISLIRLINKIGAKPRTYLQAQIVEYRKPCKSSRQIPTIKMMCSPSGVDRYERFCGRMGMNQRPIHKITTMELEDFSGIQMITTMKRLHIECEDDFFKDPYLIAQLNQSFVKKHPSFIKLEAEGFYKKKFGITGEEIFP